MSPDQKSDRQLSESLPPDPNLHSLEDCEEAYRGRDWKHYREHVSSCVELGEPGPILDIGAGLGYFVEACTRYGLPCIGLEGSLAAVEAARHRYPMDIRHHYLSRPLPADDGSFSAVVCNQTIEHLTPEIAKYMLREAFRVLKSGGVLIVNSPCRYNPREAAQPTHINLYTPRTLRAEIVAAGFCNYRAADTPRPILGAARPFQIAVRVAFRLIPWDRLSATANCVAYRS